MSSLNLRSLPLIAGTCSVVLLAGCPNAGTAPPTPGNEKFPSAAPAASSTPAAASATATPGAATPAPTATGSAPAKSPSPAASGSPAAATPTPKPTVSAPAASGETTILQGKVFDETGATVQGAKVRVRSLDSRVTYDSNTTTQEGNYVVNNVPVGVQIEVSVTRDGWTRRLRVTSLQKNQDNPNRLNFGGGADTVDPAGPGYFISNFPEVASATADADTTKGNKIVYKIKLSEPLNAENRRLFERGIRFNATTSLTGAQRSIAVSEASTFLEARQRVTMTWNTTGDELTFGFEAPMQRQKDKATTYTFKIVRMFGSDLIKDAEGKVLGRDDVAAPTSATLADGSERVTDYPNAMKMASLRLTTDPATNSSRWDDTHTKTFSFDAVRDEERPKLVKVETRPIVVSNVSYRRVTMTFSEPMRVFPDASGFSSTVETIANYRFSLSNTSTIGQDMEAAPTVVDMSTVTLGNMEGHSDATRVLRFNNDAGATDAQKVKVKVSLTDPTQVDFDIPSNIFPSKTKVIRVRVAPDVLDPAQNKVSEGSKNSSDLTADNVKDGVI